MGAKLADPSIQVVCLTGDAGLLMVLGELTTAAERGISLPIVVFADNQLALIEKKQRGMQYRSTGVAFARHDLAAIGNALGGRGVAVQSREGLAEALKDALNHDSFTLIACEIAPSSYDDRI